MKACRCPGCGQAMAEATSNPCACEVCEGCRGVWIDHVSLEAALRKEVGFSGHDPLRALLNVSSSTATGLVCPRCDANLVASSVDGLTVDWCKSCRGLFLDAGELQGVKQWRREERRQHRHETAKDVVMWLSDVAEDASELLSDSPDARWLREHPDDVHERDRGALLEILGEERPTGDPIEGRAPTGKRRSTLFPVDTGAFFLGWFLARVSLPWLGVPESPLLSWWSILGIGAVSLVTGLWLESPRRTPFPRLVLYVVQALGLVLVLEPIFGVKKMPSVRGAVTAVVIGSVLTVLATALLRYAPRRKPP